MHHALGVVSGSSEGECRGAGRSFVEGTTGRLGTALTVGISTQSLSDCSSVATLPVRVGVGARANASLVSPIFGAAFSGTVGPDESLEKL